MAKLQKIFAKILSGSKNIAFSDFILLVEGFGFRLSRVSGSHHIFVHAKVKELVNLQEVGGQIKPYQVRQFMNLVERYDLKLEEE
ncbi:MAG: type II toxin-antitoxin system HicA family toxin [Anaerolineales bacterium]|nr:type II toxin-antitoxin system HicA family toxin [Anaerolineales bacterium]